MATDESQSVLRGLLTVDPRVVDASNLWSAQSSYTQAGPLPGVPVPQRETDMVLMTTGVQAAGNQLRVQVHRAGLPGLGDSAAGFIWQYQGDTNWRGCDVPSVITSWESIEWTSTPGTLIAAKEADCITLANGDVLAIYYQQTTTTFRVGVR